MNKKVLLFSLLILGILLFIGYVSKDTEPESSSIDTSILEPEEEIIADKIEVIHFHATRQCWSCITVGEYTLKAIEEKFSEEYADGTIVFKEINIDSPENSDIVAKYRARGSSLFINAIVDGEDNIEEDTAVWRLIINEERFISYFEKKLNKLLDK